MQRATTRGWSWGRIWWGAVSSGRYLTWWTLLATGIVAQTLLGPYAGADTAADTVGAFVVSTLVWAVLAVALLPVAAAERRMPSRAARGAVVVTALALASAVRPFLNDALLWVLLGEPTTAGWVQRVATNLLAWFAITGAVAIATERYAALRDGGQRLRAAMDALAVSRAEIAAFERATGAALAEAAAQLRARRDALLAGDLDFDRVRAYSDVVRAQSHRLQDLSRADRHGFAGAPHRTAAAAPTTRDRVPVFARLRPPPLLTVGAIYAVAAAPFVLSVGGPLVLIVAIVLALLVCLGADLITRRFVRVRPPVARGILFLLTWTLAGATMTTVGMIVLPQSGAALIVPVAGFPALAALCAVCTDAVHRSTVQTQRLTYALRTVPRGLAATEASVRERLRHAADLLHGRVQARCVVFAAYIDEAEPTEVEIDAFRSGIDAALDAAVSAQVDDADSDLAGLLAAWTDVVEVASDIDARAEEVIADPVVARRVAAIVSEGLVNAVKHSAARTAELQIEPVDSGVRVRLAAPGEIVPHRTDGRGLASVGGRLTQRDRDVVLEAVVRG
ncbi:hypothetical protein N3K63_01805 [Microbacterium sp. W1N]|uniref:hypothetical protein n=1 Tax=Microbacterium festucae TaxID=2977531 RepID=UPI0021BFFA61|nr:hypothetical protein [Microbacterium festucae]MCT9819015.1 hypothetical protein [Microbacterium festucae]